MSHDSLPLSIEYGITWMTEDLDLDGAIELVVQRGDPGFGGNGYLDILSAPNWVLRRPFVFPGGKGQMHPHSINVDGDPYSELYITLNSGFGGACVAAIVKYLPDSSTFGIVAQASAPQSAGGRAAVGDFDGNGNIEFISGGSSGYSLFEWRSSSLLYIGLVDSTHGNNFFATTCSPYADGKIYPLLAHSSGDGNFGYRYQLLEATGDNNFEVRTTFQRFNGGIGGETCAAADVDCDGLDELLIEYPPDFVVMEWDSGLLEFIEGCNWNMWDIGGIMLYWHSADVDGRDGSEWLVVPRNKVFHVYKDLGCDKCECACQTDPSGCEGVIDVTDVVQAVDVAFRGSPALPDPDGDCPVTRTDVNCSGYTDVADVVKVVNVAFRAGDRNTEFCVPCP